MRKKTHNHARRKHGEETSGSGEVVVEDRAYQAMYTTNLIQFTHERDNKGDMALIAWDEHTGEISCSFYGTIASLERDLAYLKRRFNLNLWQLNQLFGFDDNSAGLPAYITLRSLGGLEQAEPSTINAIGPQNASEGLWR